MSFNWFRRKPQAEKTAPQAAVVETSSVAALPAEPAEPTATRDATAAELESLFLLGIYSDEERTNLTADFYPAGSLLFRRGDEVNALFFLLQGEILLEPSQGRAPEVVGGTPQANFPLGAGQRYATSAYAKTDVWVLRTPVWELSPESHGDTLLDVAKLVAKYPALKDDSLFYVFAKTFYDSEVKLPAIPMVVHRLRSVLAVDADIMKAAQILQAEPVLAAKVLEIANSPVFRTKQPVTSCLHAMSLLGVEITLNIVTGLCVEGLYRAKRPYVRAEMQRIWKRSVYISALSSELASKTHGVFPDEALLAGLFSHIGTLPFLNFLDEYPGAAEYTGNIGVALEAVNGPVGAHLLSRWGFPERIAGSTMYITDWFRNDGKAAMSLPDILVLANWHSQVGQPSFSSLPPLTSLPAYAKLDMGDLNPEMSLEILSGAKEEVRQLGRLLAF